MISRENVSVCECVGVRRDAADTIGRRERMPLLRRFVLHASAVVDRESARCAQYTPHRVDVVYNPRATAIFIQVGNLC